MKALGDTLDDELENSKIPKRFEVDEELDMSVLPTAMRYSSIPDSLIGQVWNASITVPGRSKSDVLAALMEEVGELATEVSIINGYSKKQTGDDGIIGEAVDIIICALDMIWVDAANNVSTYNLEQTVLDIIKAKTQKWKGKTKQPS